MMDLILAMILSLSMVMLPGMVIVFLVCLAWDRRDAEAAALRAQRQREDDDEQMAIGYRIRRELMMAEFDELPAQKPIRKATGLLSGPDAQKLLK